MMKTQIYKHCARVLMLALSAAATLNGYKLNVVNNTEEDLVIKLNTIAGDDETQVVPAGSINPGTNAVTPYSKSIEKALMVSAVEVRSRFGKQILNLTGNQRSALSRDMSVSYGKGLFKLHQDLKLLGKCTSTAWNADIIKQYFDAINAADAIVQQAARNQDGGEAGIIVKWEN
ncbi:MAG: hypothetical protein WCE21_01915 [Candidatus Babeliales bacterium]